MSVQTLERPVAHLPEASAEAPRSHSRRWPLSLVALFCVATLYHWLQSRGHVTPAVFTDELMFSELARSLAEGNGLTVRGHDFSFPAVVPVLFQAPAWLLGGASAYALAKTLNAALMCLAVFPAWGLARLVLRPGHAFCVAVATVAGGAMLYHSYLTSEAVAYPIYLLAVAVCVRALAEPSRRWDIAAVFVLVIAVLTRAQFVALPIAFLIAVLLVGRPLRRHAVALVALGTLAVGAAVQGVSGLGFYAGAGQLDYSVVETLRWAGWTASLLPFTAGILVVPGALMGLGYAVTKARSRGERAFGVMALLLFVAGPLQAGLIASGEADRPVERYAFYAVPLLFVSFFLYVERGAPRRMLYAAVALAVGGVTLAVPLASLAVDPFSFDSTTLSAVADLGRRLALGDAVALFVTVGLAAALLAAALPLRRVAVPVAALSIFLAFAIGIAAYSGDRRMTRRALDAAPAQPDWLDRLGLPDADVLVLPGGSPHVGWMLESWNRNVGRTLHLGDVHVDPLPYTQVAVLPDGVVADGSRKPIRSGYVVANDFATQVELVGSRVATPIPGLTLYKPEGALRLTSLAEGLYHDGWARAVLNYTAWPKSVADGWYRVRLELPRGSEPRGVTLAAGPFRTQGRLAPERPLELRIPVSGRPIPPLAIRIDRADLIGAKTVRPRLVGARVTRLDFVPSPGSRNQ